MAPIWAVEKSVDTFIVSAPRRSSSEQEAGLEGARIAEDLMIKFRGSFPLSLSFPTTSMRHNRIIKPNGSQDRRPEICHRGCSESDQRP